MQVLFSSVLDQEKDRIRITYLHVIIEQYVYFSSNTNFQDQYKTVFSQCRLLCLMTVLPYSILAILCTKNGILYHFVVKPQFITLFMW